MDWWSLYTLTTTMLRGRSGAYSVGVAIWPLSTSMPLIETPEVLPWNAFYNRWAATGKPDPRKGSHVLYDGPTQSGKTLLCRHLCRLRSFVVVFGTKAQDTSLDEYIAEGYYRIKQWPPSRDDWKKSGWGSDEARFILWPDIENYADLHKYRNVYAKCLQDNLTKKAAGWTLVIDEGLWVCARHGLNLGPLLEAIAYGSSSLGTSMYLLLQRPANVPRVTWSSVMDVMQFHAGVTADVRELASLGTEDPKSVTVAVKKLQGHQFLHLPCRGGATWAISEVAV
jgi:hypothetical protein